MHLVAWLVFIWKLKTVLRTAVSTKATAPPIWRYSHSSYSGFVLTTYYESTTITTLSEILVENVHSVCKPFWNKESYCSLSLSGLRSSDVLETGILSIILLHFISDMWWHNKHMISTTRAQFCIAYFSIKTDLLEYFLHSLSNTWFPALIANKLSFVSFEISHPCFTSLVFSSIHSIVHNPCFFSMSIRNNCLGATS